MVRDVLRLSSARWTLLVLLFAATAVRGDDADVEQRVKALGGRVARDAAQPGRPITEVEFHEKPPSPADIRALATLKDLRSLIIHSTGGNKAVLEELAVFTSLQELSLPDLTDVDLQLLAPLKSLTQLDLGRTAVTGAGLKHLAHLKNLRALDLHSSDVSDDGLREVGQLANLESLDLRWTQVTDRGIRHLARLTKLTKLDLHRTKVTDQGLRYLSTLPNLAQLDIANTAVPGALTDAGIKELARLPKLRSLDISFSKVTAAGIMALTKRKYLRLTLDVGQLPAVMTDEVVVALHGAGMLHRLEVGGNSMDGMTWVQHATTPAGRGALTLQGAPLTDAGFKEFADFTNLRNLDLRKTNLTDATMRELARFPKLDKLFLRDTRVTAAGLKHLKNLPSLWLLDYPVTDQVLKDLRGLGLLHTLSVASGYDRPDRVAKRPSRPDAIRFLNLSGSAVSDAGLQELANCTNLCFLDLSRTKVTDAGMKQVALFKKLEILKLDGTKVTAKGLAELKGLNGLQRVEVDIAHGTLAGLRAAGLLHAVSPSNRRGDERVIFAHDDDGLVTMPPMVLPANGAVPMPVPMPKRIGRNSEHRPANAREVMTLNLRKTAIADDDLKELVEFSNLQRLSLRETRVSNAGVKHLLALHGLQSLDVRRTRITGAGLKMLLKLPKLKTLRFGRGQINDAVLIAFAADKSLHRLATLPAEEEPREPGLFSALLSAVMPAATPRLPLTQQGMLRSPPDPKTLPATDDAVVSLDLSGARVGNAGVKALAKLPKLSTLALCDTRVTDAVVPELARFKMLHTLDLGGTRVTNAAMRQLADMKQLRRLSLCGTRVTPAGVRTLLGNRELQELWLHASRVGDELVATSIAADRFHVLRAMGDTGDFEGAFLGADAEGKPATRCADVVDLDLYGLPISGAVLTHLKAFDKLEFLALDATRIGDAGLVDLAQLKKLEDLSLVGTRVTDAGMRHLAGLTHLKGVDLTQTTITEAGVKHLAGLQQLDTLGLAGTRVTDTGMKSIGNMMGLATLDLSGTSVTDTGLRELGRLKNLEELKLSPDQVTDRAVLTLAELGLLHALQSPEPTAPPTLEEFAKNGGRLSNRNEKRARRTMLDLSNSRVTDAVMPTLAGLPKVEWLVLRGTRITDAGLEHLARLKTLKLLDVRNTAVTEKAIAKLRRASPDCRIESGGAARWEEQPATKVLPRP